MRRAIGFLLLMISWTSSAAAHTTSTGLAMLEVNGGNLAYRLTVVATEVDDQGGRLLVEAAGGDRAAAERVAGFLRDYARFSVAGEPCQPGHIAIRGSSAGDYKVVLDMALSCPKSVGALAIHDDWPEVLGARFQTVLSVRVPERPSVELVFLEDRRSATLDLAVPADTGWGSFVAMGVEHIVGGLDHLLFLVALLAPVRGLWHTVKIVTAFTVAHSVTLSLATLGVVDVPARIVEPLIAASIVWVAVENLVAPAGLGRRWLVAATFGLIHGLGFASALTEFDLDAGVLVRALIGFNVGVELGQLAFVAVVLPPLAWASRPGRLPRLPPLPDRRWSRRTPRSSCCDKTGALTGIPKARAMMRRMGGSSMSMVRLAAAALAVCLALPVAAQGIPKAQSPEEVGFLSTRLKRLSDRINEGVKNNELPGAVVLIARNGKLVMFDSFGYRDKVAKAPMTNDAIFRIASMTKPITSVAAMVLVEEGRLSLADPVSRYIPAFAHTKVAVPKKKDDGTVEMALEPQARPMTVQDLMRHTSGLTYGMLGTNPVRQSYLDMKVADRGQTLAEMADKLAKLALLYQPGTTWEYSMSTDLLGRVIEVAAGMPLDKFIEERITRPLKMGDTAFEVGADKKARSARPMREGPANAMPPIPDVTEKFTWRSGGGGMVSTAADYARFLQMFANGGQLDGVRVISRKTIDLMTADALPPDIRIGEDMWRLGSLVPGARMGQGFGLGFAVRTEQGRNPLPGSPGDYQWGGAYGTTFWHDPRERMYVVFMMQAPAAGRQYRRLMRALVYQALVGS